MSDLLPDQPPPRVAQVTGAITRRALAGLDALVVVLPHAARVAAWRGVPDALRLRAQLRAAGGERHVLRSRLADAAGTAVVLAEAPRAADAFARLKFAGELATAALDGRPRRVGVACAGFDGEATADMTIAVLMALGAAAFRMPEYRRKRARGPRLGEVRILGLPRRLDVARAQVETEALNLVRWLTALPPNRLTVAGYREAIGRLTEHHDWSMRFLDQAALRRLGAGAFLAVARGSEIGDAGIVHLAWRPRGRGRPDVALVGKGIVFDTGGTNLKPFRAMLDMHHDMCGSAVALATLLAITRLGLPIAVDCWLAIAENRIGPQAYKSRDVVTAADGTTIEVIHTDAEGRMALADTLVLAAREKPGLVLDFATLTGQCVNALTDRYSGVFSNRPALAALLADAGRACGERVWPFPMDEDFDEELKSGVADVLQCSTENEGDHILAARFLQRFVPKATPWAHVDLASATRRKGLAQVPGGPTGFGVRLALNLLIDQAGGLARVHRTRPHGD
jgi:leucyl aminopeptidase